ncbi:hypothetical protein P4O66_001035 [Electrophorus voltai]|uniref:PH domain-containing protein n=1 Tax=Electrophorus voltai TaxID=2609070 RepID=A0AAD8Z9U9_9TELE|nr:hypothetical protein P4O66_001035 [Electrophorus voltai]
MAAVGTGLRRGKEEAQGARQCGLMVLPRILTLQLNGMAGEVAHVMGSGSQVVGPDHIKLGPSRFPGTVRTSAASQALSNKQTYTSYDSAFLPGPRLCGRPRGCTRVSYPTFKASSLGQLHSGSTTSHAPCYQGPCRPVARLRGQASAAAEPGMALEVCALETEPSSHAASTFSPITGKGGEGWRVEAGTEGVGSEIPELPHVQNYLNSVHYIEELQKFVEDDNYKLSLKIEPATSTPRATASREDLVGPDASGSPLCGRRGNVAEGALPKVPPTPPSPRNLLPYGHRKCHSLGYNFIHKMNTVEFKSATFPNAGSRHLLDDSVLESHTPTRGQAESSTLSSGISLGSSEGSELSEEMSWPAFERTRFYHSLGPVTRVGRISYRGGLRPSSSAESEELAVHLYPGAVTVQGVLRRKTLLKEGKKPTVASWTKYWVALCGTQLYYYTAKSLKATERKHFKSTASKCVSVVGLMAMMADDPEHPDVFLLTDSEHEALRKPRAKLSHAIREAKRAHAQRIHGHFKDTGDTRRMWKGIQAITNYRKTSPCCDSDAILPDAVNDFYARFEAQNNVAAEKSIPPQNDQVLCPTAADVRRTLRGVNPRKAAGPDNIPGRVLRE